MVVIEARNLCKRFRVPIKAPGIVGALKHILSPHYEEKVAVDGITFTIEEGESIAYVGPNGAGKSTTVKMLTGILVPSTGEIRVLGLVPYQHRTENARNIGVVFGQRSQLWWDLPVIESFRLLGDIYQIPTSIFKRNLEEFVELLELETLLPFPTRQLSLGQRMRCDLAASMLHDPAVIFLDEPTIGLDIAVKERIRRFIRRVNQEHKATILLTSHDMSDVEKICNRLVMIDRGKLVYDGSIHTFKERFGRTRIIHLVLERPDSEAVKRAYIALADIAQISEIQIQQQEPHQVLVQFNALKTTAKVLMERLLNVLPIVDLQLEESSIESIIQRLYDGELSIGDSDEDHIEIAAPPIS